MGENNDIMIRTEGLSKRYTLGETLEMYGNFREALMTVPRALGRMFKSGSGKNTVAMDSNKFWALRDVSFEVKRGEVVGIIGRNGAGKSTLLKILSRITEPTRGEAFIYGRLASLLEVGTGFHPELSGRENIYLNGSILGMHKAEIDKKFDEIIDFAEVAKFIDTPVKRYSSGMYVRLAFAVAAHLEPEILLIDEVLAVGDIAFQKKCVKKIDSVSSEGRTILFVSHNIGLISDLCTRCILLRAGQVVADDKPQLVINEYFGSDTSGGYIDLTDWNEDRTKKGPFELKSLSIVNALGHQTGKFSRGDEITFQIEIEGRQGSLCIIGLSIRDNQGHLIVHFLNPDVNFTIELPADRSIVSVHWPNIILNDGTYYVTILLNSDMNIMNDRVGNCLSFEVESASQGYIRSRGSVLVDASWSTCQSPINTKGDFGLCH